jgi:hypothetical protein
MIGHDFDQRLSLNTINAESSPTQERGRGGVDVQQEILSQLSRAKDVKGVLDRLRKQDPAMYAEALRSLQQVMGNSGVNKLLGGDASASTLVTQAMEMVKGGTETPMPMRSEMDSAFGGVGDVKFMTGAKVNEALDMVGAEAAAFGNVIAARGTNIAKDVLAEEIAHTKQQAGATGGGDVAMTTPSDVFEAEAAQIAATVAAGGRAPAVQQKSGDRVMLARRSFFSSVASGAKSAFRSIFGGGPPERVSLNIGGATLTIPMPSNHNEDEKRVTLNTAGVRCPVPGMQISGVEVVFNDSWEVQSGTVRASLQAGPYVSVSNVELTIKSGGQVDALVKGIQFDVGGIVSGTMDLRLSGGGVSGNVTIQHTDIQMPGGLTLSGGSLNLQLNNGQITASGSLTCRAENLGAELTLRAQLNNDQLTGSLTASITEAFTIGDAVTVKSGSVTGQFSKEGFTVSGNVNFQVKDWVESTFQGTYKYPAQTWDATGQLRQVQEIQFGGISVRDMVVSASVKDSQFEGLRATGAFSVPNFEGNIDCAYDAQAQIINGTGSIRTTQEIPLGATGAILKEAGGTVTIENNALKTITGAAKAELQFDGQPTFEVSVTGGTFQMEGQTLSGSGAVKTLRDLQFGNPTGLRAEVKTGAGGEVTMADNQIASFTTGIAFTVHDAEGQFGTGNVSFNYTDQTSVNGEATFTLDSDYGVPDRLNGPGKLKAGSSLSATVQAGQLQSVQLKGAKMELANPSGAGLVEASLEGSWDFQNSQLDAEGKAEFKQPWVVAAPWATLTLGPVGATAGEITTKIEQNQIKKLEGSLPFECQIPFQGQNIDVAGLVKGEFNAESLTVTGDIEAAPKAAFSVTFADSSVLNVKPETKISAHIGESQLESMKFALNADYDSAGTKPIKLALEISDASFVPDSGFTGIGKVSLRENYDVDVTWAEGGKVTLLGGAEGSGGSVEASLTNNNLDWVKGQIPYKAEMKIQGADVKVVGKIDGTYEAGAISGSIDANIAEETTIPVGALSGNLILKPATKVTATIAQNNLDALKFGLDAEYHRAGTPLLKVGVQIPDATYDPAQGFSGEGQASLIDDCVLQGLTWTNGGSLTLKAGGTGLTAKITHNNIDSLTGGILFKTTLKITGQDVNIDGKIDGAYEGTTQKVSGAIDAALTNEPILNLPGGSSTLHLKNGTNLKATIGDTELQSAKFNLKADFTRTNTPFLGGGLKLAIDMADVGYERETGVSGKGSVTIKENCDIQVPWSDGGKITLKGGAGGGGLNATLENSALTELDGKIPFLAKLNIQNQKVDIDGNIQGKMTAGATGAGVTGQIDAKLLSNPTLDMGAAGQLQFLDGTSIQAKIAESALTEMSFVLKANYDMPASTVLTQGLKAKLDIPTAKFTPEMGGSFDGQGTIALREACTVMPYSGLTLNLKSGSLSGQMEKTKLKSGEGNLAFDASLKLFGTTSADVEGKIQATYTGTETGGTFGGDIDAKLKNNLTIASAAGGAQFDLIAPDTKVKATVTDSALANVQFTVVADYTQTGGILRGEGLKLRATLENATYAPDAGFNGTGVLTLKSDCDMAVGEVTAKLLKEGSSVTGTVENSALKTMTGTVGFESEIPVGAQRAKIKGAVENVTYTAPSTFGGSVNAALKNELNFEVGGATLKMLADDTKVKATFGDNAFTDVKFGLHAHYDKPADATFETPLKLDAKIEDGVYDAATGLSGKGSVSLRDNCVVKAGESVKVTLKGTSAVSGEMENNDVKQIKGAVQFESAITIDKAKGTTANVDGTIDAEYNKAGGAPTFGGTFDAKVKDDFDVGSGDNLLKVKGQVTNINAKLEGSEISAVKLNLTAEYTRTGAPFDANGMKLEVKLADATYTKDSSSISGDGSIKLLQDAKATFADGKAAVVLKGNSSVQASVSQNELKSFNGDMGFEMKLAVEGQGDLDLGGSLNANYTKETGSVNGELNAALKKEFTIAKEGKEFKLKPEVTKMRATLAAGNLSEINADLDADYIHTGAPFTQPLDLNIKLTNANYKRESGDVGGQGSLSLNKPCKLESGENSLTLKEGSNIQTVVEASKLKSFTGDVKFDAGVKIANAVANIEGQVKANYDGDQSKFGGTFDAKVKDNFTLGEGANTLTVKANTTKIKATLAENDLKDISFDLDADYVRQPSGVLKTPLDLNVKLTNATYTKESNSVSGQGSITLNSLCEVSAGEGNKVTLQPNSTVAATVANNDLESFNGSIGYAAEIKLGAQTAQVSGNGNFQYAKQGDTSSVNAEVSGKLDNTLTFGPETSKVSVLNDNTNVKAKLADSKFDSVEFNLHAHYDRVGAPFAGNGLLLDISLQNAKYEEAAKAVSGSGSLKLRENTTIQSGESTVTIKAEGSALQGTLASNELETFKGRVLFESNLKLAGKDVKISGNIAADYEKSAGFGGQVFAKLDEDVSIENGDTTVVIKNDSDVNAKFTSEGLKELKFNLHAHYDQKGSAFDPAQYLKLDLKVGNATYADDKLSGTGGISLRSPCKVKANQDGSTNVTLTSGALNGTLQDNVLTSLTGNAQFESEIKVKEGSILKVKGGLNASYTSDGNTSEINGAINASVAEPCLVTQGQHAVTIQTDTTVSATLDKGEFKGVKFGLHADYVYSGGESPLHLDLRLANGSYIPDKGFSGEGSVRVVDPYTVKFGESEGVLKAGSNVTATVVENKLTKAAGTFLFSATVKVADKDVKVDGELSGDFNNEGALPIFNAVAKAQLAEPVDFVFGTNEFKLLTDTKVRASVKNNAFEEIKFDLHANTKHSGFPFSGEQPLKLDLQLKDVGYKASEGFSGQGTLSLLDDCTVAVGGNTIKLLKAGTQASGVVKNSELESLNGQIAFESEINVQNQPIKVKGSVAGSYEKGKGINGRAEAQVKETTAPIPLGGIGTLVIYSDTQISAEVKDTQFDNLKFNLHADYARTANPAITVELRATMDYNKTDGFSGQASAEVKSDNVELLKVGEYTLFLQKGTGAIVKVDKNELTHVGGTINLMLKDTEGDFVKASVTADYKVKENQFSGNGQAEVVREKKLGEVGAGEKKLTLFVEKGTGATIDVAANKLQSIGGTVKVRADDAEGEFIRVTLAGTFDAAGGTGFSGSGSAEILHDKKLVALGDYEFWIKTGTGAIVTLDKNALKEVGGTINFLVKNKDASGQILPFIEGSVSGTYKADEGKFSGSGEVKLARDITFDISGDTKIKFLAGSGGGGTVKDNKLEKLTGNLKAMVIVKGQDYLKVEAGGEYDAINNKIVYLDGSAELLQPIKLFGDKVIISNLKGNARIENNKLVRAGGSAKIDVPGVSGFNITGTVDNFLWRNVGGRDLYSGAGSITIEKPGRVKGTVRGEIFEDGKFNVEGEVELIINEMLKGMIGIKMDQTFNPEIKGELSVKAELIKARDLFSFSQKLFDMKVDVMAGPVPITIGAGAAFGFKVSTQPVVFEGKIGIEGFRPLEMNIPRFTAEAALKTGLEAKAELIPYVKVGLGVGGVLAAGLKLKGILSATAAADLGLSLKLAGDGNGVGGSVGVDLGLKISADLSVIPEVYCDILSMEFSKSLASFNFALGELFSWNWGTSFPFGNGPAVQAAPAAKTQPAAQKTVDTGASKESDPSGELQSKYGSAKDPGPVKDGPTLPGPDQLKGETDASKKTNEQPTDSKFDKMMKIAGKVGGVAKTAGKLMDALGTAWTILTVGSMIPIPFGGPLAAGLYLVYLHISGKLTFGDVVKMFKDVFEIAKMLVDEGIITLPGWLKSIIDFFGQYDSVSAGVKGLISKAADYLREKFPSWTKVITAAEKVLNGMVDVLAELISAITGGGISLKTLLSIIGKLGSAVVELIGAVAEMIGEAVMGLVKEVGEALGSIGRGLVNIAGRVLGAIGDGLRSVGRALTSW